SSAGASRSTAEWRTSWTGEIWSAVPASTPSPVPSPSGWAFGFATGRHRAPNLEAQMAGGPPSDAISWEPMEVSQSSAGTLRALSRLVRALRLADRAAESRLGLSAAQLFVLERLGEGPVGSMAELAGRTLTDASSVSVVVQRLAERGLVVRATAPDDARRTTLRLSSAGKRLLTTAPRSPQVDLLDALERLSAPERKD